MTQAQKLEKIRQLRGEIRDNMRRATTARTELIRSNCFTRAFRAEDELATLEAEIKAEKMAMAGAV